MPYTAPLKPLLSAQHIEYCDPTPEARLERPGLVRSTSARLHNSRSYSSTSYVRRHRRSPSICKSTGLASSQPASRVSPINDPNASLRQSPPPVNNAAIPPGAVISPPESAPNSSDEESPFHAGESIKLEELEAAVRSIEQRREGSPERSPEKERMGPAEQLGTEAEPSSSQSTPTFESASNHLRLSKEARKIAHSRSSTETSIDRKREEALTSSPDDSDVESRPRPPMVRKKSGELVRPALRPASAKRRPSSMPGTPVYAKAVHFDSHLEHIRHFLQVDRPLAVSAETSPVDSHEADREFPFGHDENKRPAWEWELRLANFPKDTSSRASHAVRLERLFLSANKNTLVGSVAVANLAFHKHVAARFTFDYWRTVSEVGGVYCHDVRRKHDHDGYDRFSFDIKLNDQTNLERKTMFVCIRYNVNGQEFWDNNNGANYQVDFLKTSKAVMNKPSGGARPALPRSRTFTGSHSGRPLSMPPSFNDSPGINKNVPFSNPFAVSNGPPLTRTPSDEIDTVGPPKRRETPNRQAFGNRYDFGASLTAAIRTKPPLDRTTLTARARSELSSGTAEKESDTLPDQTSPVSDGIRGTARTQDLKPSSLVTSKPCLESSGYKELVDKYCFYGSPKASHTKQSFAVNIPSDAASRNPTPGTPSPPLSPRSPAPLDSPAPEAFRESPSPSLSPASLSPRTSPSPMPYRYPYHTTIQTGFLVDPQSSPAISG
ncbi:uncharacterized protein N7459_001447 [Penicillium hispanicum]|uniref:uncharacterized protein n=1 Tax=Penicillium hispanicum TaxID=1080232 RepID=UPI00254205C9|nr:uncharacterized protein N7459_001447 [Penicillium hispanicum]KAJ5595239.1 hypothetical protein N7459_001447 [Penicillium hispanicum]